MSGISKEQFIKAMNQQYITNKQLEIAMEGTRIAAETKNEDIANAAVDSYTLELMEEGVI